MRLRGSIAVMVLFAIIASTSLLARPLPRAAAAWPPPPSSQPDLPPGCVDDASRMNSTHAAEVVDVARDPASAEQQLRKLLDRARRDHLKVAISGARHTMGGHTIYPNGIVLNMLPFNRMQLDSGQRLLHVGAGARWSEVIPYLDARGFFVAVMQSNNDFSIGGSLSVNCHGWHVLADRDTVLRYADREMFSFVMLFSQPRTPDANSRMEAMTRELIDAALSYQGRYYLPYRLHATAGQFARAYPYARDFFKEKRHFDPHEIFQNQFYVKYGSP